MAHSSVPQVDRSALLAVLAEQPDDTLQELLRRVSQAGIQAQFEEFVGVDRYLRSDDRRDYRNGSRERRLDTRLGTIALDVPRTRSEAFRPTLFEHRRRSESALIAAVQEMVINGVSTRKVEKVLAKLGVEGMSKSQVSVLCAQLDGSVKAFRERPLEAAYPYVMLDALYVKVREDGRVGNQAVVIAYAVNEHGTREVIGIDVVQTESTESWTTFLRSLRERGLRGVELVVSDAHQGLKAAIRAILGEGRWQRCRVHFLRNVLAHVGQHRKLEIAAAFRAILAQESPERAREHAARVIAEHSASCPKAMEILADGLDDALNFFAFPAEHHRKLWSTNPIEHLNGSLRKRTNVVGIFPNAKAAIRLISMVLIEQTEDWLTERSYMSEASMGLVKRLSKE